MISIKDKIIMLIFGDKFNGNQLYKQTGLNPSTYTTIRKGERNIGNLTVDTAVKLEKLYDELEAKGEIKFNDQIVKKYKKRYDHNK